MGRRHSCNNTNHAVFSRYERERAAKEGRYGTRTARLGKNSMRRFDCCAISLQPCRNPVVTKNGMVYDKESILNYIVEKKKSYKRALKKWEQQNKELEARAASKSDAAHDQKVQAFLDQETLVTGATPLFKPTATADPDSDAAKAVVSGLQNKDETHLPAFWVASKTPTAEPTRVEKPTQDIRCPLTDVALKAKDLLDIEFTPIDKTKKNETTQDNARFMCPLSRVALSNSVPCVVLRTSGKVIAAACVKEFLGADMVDPFTNVKMKESDIIPIKSDGGGFAGSGAKKVTLEAVVATYG